MGVPQRGRNVVATWSQHGRNMGATWVQRGRNVGATWHSGPESKKIDEN